MVELYERILIHIIFSFAKSSLFCTFYIFRGSNIHFLIFIIYFGIILNWTKNYLESVKQKTSLELNCYDKTCRKVKQEVEFLCPWKPIESSAMCNRNIVQKCKNVVANAGLPTGLPKKEVRAVQKLKIPQKLGSKEKFCHIQKYMAFF